MRGSCGLGLTLIHPSTIESSICTCSLRVFFSTAAISLGGNQGPSDLRYMTVKEWFLTFGDKIHCTL